MGVIFSAGYAPYAGDSGDILLEDAFHLLLEDGGRVLLDYPDVDYPLTHARIAHSRNWVTGGTVTASSTATGYFAAAPDNSLTYERWKPETVSATWAYALPSPAEVNYCCIAAHTMGTNGNNLQVQYDLGAGWVAVIPLTAITDDSDIFVMFPSVTAANWRILIGDGSAPEIGVVKFGKAMQMARPLYGGHSPMPYARNTVLKTNESQSGEILGQSKYRTYLETKYSWNNLSSPWMRVNWPDFQRAIETEAFFIAWRPGTFSDVAFGRAMGTSIPTNIGTRDLMSVELTMRARSYD